MKYFYASIIFFASLAVFMLLEYGRMTLSLNEFFQPLIFSFVVVVIFLYAKFRKAILLISLLLLVLMVISYMFGFLTVSNWIGGLGIGILVIIISSYFPKLVKNGHI